MLQVKDIMSQQVLTTREDTDIHALAKMLNDYNISGAPVLSSEGSLVGVITLNELAAHQSGSKEEPPAYWSHLPNVDRAFKPHELSDQVKVKELMTPGVHVIDDDATLPTVIDYMTENHVYRLLVIREKKLAGIVTTSDLLKQFKRVLLADAGQQPAPPEPQ